jgi:nucleoside-diphosphate-sugar epimerase
MTTALIGHTGFVGGAIARSWHADALFNSANIEAFAGREFELVVSAGAYAEKWRINQDPSPDDANIDRLLRNLRRSSIRQLVLISTVDVFSTPIGVDEATPVPLGGAPYGRHRLRLEQACRADFRTLVVRLPGLYGVGLKKNAIFDLLHDHEVERLNGSSSFQFYPTHRLWADISIALDAGLDLVHLVTEPVELHRVASELFGRGLRQDPGSAVSYDVRTAYARLFHGSGQYVQTADEVMAGLAEFVDQQPARVE